MEETAAVQPDVEAHVWVVRAGQGGVYAEMFRELGLIAIGFGVAESVAGLSWDAIAELKRRVDPNATAGAIGQATGALYRIAAEINQGDFVLSPEPGSSLLVGRVTSDYEFVNPPPMADHYHVRRITWRGRLDRSELSDDVRHSIGSLLTLFLPAQQIELLATIKALSEAAPPGPPKSAEDQPQLPEQMTDPPAPSGSEPATDKQPLTFLLDKIQNRELGLPDFQRSFVWDPTATRELIASIARGFPVGNLLFLRGSSDVFVPRAGRRGSATRWTSAVVPRARWAATPFFFVSSI